MQGFDFCDQEMNPERLFLEGKSDDVVQKIIDDCEWQDDVEIVVENAKNLPAIEISFWVALKATKKTEKVFRDCLYCNSIDIFVDFISGLELFKDITN